MTHLAMSFAISQPGITSALLGARTMVHLDDLLAGMDTVLSDDGGSLDALRTPGNAAPLEPLVTVAPRADASPAFTATITAVDPDDDPTMLVNYCRLDSDCPFSWAICAPQSLHAQRTHLSLSALSLKRRVRDLEGWRKSRTALIWARASASRRDDALPSMHAYDQPSDAKQPRADVTLQWRLAVARSGHRGWSTT